MATVEVEKTEEVRGVEELREEYEQALAREREIVAEIRALSADEEQAVEAADEILISEVARRRLELPMHLMVVMRRRARLLLQVTEAEFEEASAERQQASEKVLQVEKAFRKAERKLEEERNVYAGADGEYIAAREQLARAQEGLNRVLAMDARAVLEGLEKGARNV